MAVALSLDELLRSDPNTTKINLSVRGLTDLTPLVPKLAAFTSLRELDLRANALDSLPSNLSSLRQLQVLDLGQNPITRATSVLSGLSSLPNLYSLTIGLSAEEEGALLTGLPTISTFNGFDLGRRHGRAGAGASGPSAGSAAGAPGETGPAPVREIAMTEGDLESVAVLYGGIKSLRGRVTSEEETRLTNVFDTHIRTVMSDLKTRLDKLDDAFLRQAEILSAKYELYDVCFQQCIDFASSSSREFGSVLRKLHQTHQSLFSEFPRVVYDMKPVYDERVQSLETALEQSREETAQLLEAAELLERETQVQQEERGVERTGFENERASLLAEIESLRAQLEEAPKRPAARTTSSTPAAKTVARLRAQGKAAEAKDGATRSKAGGGTGAGGAPPPPPPVRALSLKQLKEVIEAIYASKIKFDAKCAEAKLPKETMEQHMYTYLNQKYGLKALIIEHASSIIRAVNKFGKSDIDVGVFGRILRNEVDEEFRHVQHQLRESVQALLTVYMQGKHPLKSDEAVKTMVTERMSGFVFEEEWVDIIKYMYNSEDALVLIVRIRDIIRMTDETDSPRGSAKPRTSRGARGKIRYAELVKVLLEFQLKSHERFLSRFRQAFRAVDIDKNGILDHDEFRALVARVSPGKSGSEVEEILRQVDPHGNAFISFSECVSSLSGELAVEE